MYFLCLKKLWHFKLTLGVELSSRGAGLGGFCSLIIKISEPKSSDVYGLDDRHVSRGILVFDPVHFGVITVSVIVNFLLRGLNPYQCRSILCGIDPTINTCERLLATVVWGINTLS